MLFNCFGIRYHLPFWTVDSPVPNPCPLFRPLTSFKEPFSPLR